MLYFEIPVQGTLEWARLSCMREKVPLPLPKTTFSIKISQIKQQSISFVERELMNQTQDLHFIL